MAKTFRRRPDDDEDEDELLEDGQIARVPLMLRDAQPRWVADADRYFGERAADSRVIGVDGMPESLHRPGYRFGDANKASLDAKEQAYDAYDQWLQDAWKGADREGYSAGSEGSVCTVSGERFPEHLDSPGHVRRLNGDLICVPDSNATGDAMTVDEAYNEYDAALREAWRTPPTGADAALRTWRRS